MKCTLICPFARTHYNFETGITTVGCSQCLGNDPEGYFVGQYENVEEFDIPCKLRVTDFIKAVKEKIRWIEFLVRKAEAEVSGHVDSTAQAQ